MFILHDELYSEPGRTTNRPKLLQTNADLAGLESAPVQWQVKYVDRPYVIVGSLFLN